VTRLPAGRGLKAHAAASSAVAPVLGPAKGRTRGPATAISVCARRRIYVRSPAAGNGSWPQAAAPAKAGDRLRQITKRNRAVSLEQMIGEANTFLAGWVMYFRQAHARSELRGLDGWLRRKLCCVRLKECKQPQGLRRFLKQAGVAPRQARELASSGRGWWDREEPPYSIYPAAERSKGGPRLSPGKRFYRIASLDHFVSC
jgi:hypothetical protein